jgi:hypothetical protein
MSTGESGVRIILIGRKFVVSDSCSRISINSLAFRKALCIIELRNTMILIRRKFEVSNTFPHISINAVAFHKAEGINELGVRNILICRKFVGPEFRADVEHRQNNCRVR